MWATFVVWCTALILSAVLRSSRYEVEIWVSDRGTQLREQIYGAIAWSSYTLAHASNETMGAWRELSCRPQFFSRFSQEAQMGIGYAYAMMSRSGSKVEA